MAIEYDSRLLRFVLRRLLIDLIDFVLLVIIAYFLITKHSALFDDLIPSAYNVLFVCLLEVIYYHFWLLLA